MDDAEPAQSVDESDASSEPEVSLGAATAEKVLAQFLATSVGVAVGLGIAGPAGGIAGAFTGQMIAPVFEAIIARDRRGMQNANVVVECAAELAGQSPSAIGAWAHRDDQRLYLLGQTVHAAMGTLSDPKVFALGRILANALLDDARIDMSLLAVRALSELEAPHLRVLHTMTRESGFEEPRDIGSYAWTVDELRSRLPHLREGMSAIIAVLDRNGLTVARDSFLGSADARYLTEFGYACMEIVEATGRA